MDEHNNNSSSVLRASSHWKEETKDVVVVAFVVVLQSGCTIVCQGRGWCESLVCPWRGALLVLGRHVHAMMTAKRVYGYAPNRRQEGY